MLPLIAHNLGIHQEYHPRDRKTTPKKSLVEDPAITALTMQMHYLPMVLCDPGVQEAAMTVHTEEFSKHTDRYQTTVPSGVRNN